MYVVDIFLLHCGILAGIKLNIDEEDELKMKWQNTLGPSNKVIVSHFSMLFNTYLFYIQYYSIFPRSIHFLIMYSLNGMGFKRIHLSSLSKVLLIELIYGKISYSITSVSSNTAKTLIQYIIAHQSL